MSLTFDGWLAVAGIIGVIIVGVIATRRPEKLHAEYQEKIDLLIKVHREELTALEKRYQEKIDALGRRLEVAQSKIGDLELEYRRMATEYLRIIGENHWLRIQLRMKNIDIPPLPDDLRPKTDAQGNISIIVSPNGGLQVMGGQVHSGDVNRTDVSGTAGQVISGRDGNQQQS